MRRFLFSLLVAFSVTACSQPQQPGLPDKKAAREAAEAFMLRADPKAVIRNMEEGMITSKEEQSLTDFAKQWKPARLRSFHEKTEERTLPEFEIDRQIFKKTWPAGPKYAPVQWSETPDVVFVCYFTLKDPKEPMAAMYFLGAYQRKGRWFFSKQL